MENIDLLYKVGMYHIVKKVDGAKPENIARIAVIDNDQPIYIWSDKLELFDFQINHELGLIWSKARLVKKLATIEENLSFLNATFIIEPIREILTK